MSVRTFWTCSKPLTDPTGLTSMVLLRFESDLSITCPERTSPWPTLIMPSIWIGSDKYTFLSHWFDSVRVQTREVQILRSPKTVQSTDTLNRVTVMDMVVILLRSLQTGRPNELSVSLPFCGDRGIWAHWFEPYLVESNQWLLQLKLVTLKPGALH